jgi:hypothetical protein
METIPLCGLMVEIRVTIFMTNCVNKEHSMFEASETKQSKSNQIKSTQFQQHHIVRLSGET